MSGQVCASLTRIVVPRNRHDEFADALSAAFSSVQVGDPFDAATQMVRWPWNASATGSSTTSRRASRRGRTSSPAVVGPRHLKRGYYIEPTVFSGVDNKHVIAQEEIFGPVLSVIPADSEEHAVDIANDTIYGLNASVFTPDIARAREVAGKLRSGTVGHNNMRLDFGVAFGGSKQSGMGREGGLEGLLPYLETEDASPRRGATGLRWTFLKSIAPEEIHADCGHQFGTHPLPLSDE